MTGIESGSVRANDVTFHYLAMGEGPLLLCLHGFPDHARSFQHQLRYFSALGYRVIAPLMRGYPPTATPAGATFYAADLAHDVVALVRSLGASRATLLGHDWGARAAYGAAVLAPEMFDRLVTLALPYGPGLRTALIRSPDQQRRSWYIFFFRTKLAEAALTHDQCALIQRLWHDWSPGWTLPKRDMDDIRTLFASPKAAEAALAYYRHAFGTAPAAGAHTDLERRIGVDPIRIPASISTAIGTAASTIPSLTAWMTCFRMVSTVTSFQAPDIFFIWSARMTSTV
jgi:pimeloyl-ACP methyl ester carboxylesterase